MQSFLIYLFIAYSWSLGCWWPLSSWHFPSLGYLVRMEWEGQCRHNCWILNPIIILRQEDVVTQFEMELWFGKRELDNTTLKYQNCFRLTSAYHMYPVVYLSESVRIIASGFIFIENYLVLNYINLSTLEWS